MLAEIVPLAREDYKASRERKSKDFDKVKLQTDTEIKEVEESLKPKANPQADEPPPDRKATERKLNASLKRLENLNLDDYTEEQQTDIRESGVRLRALAQEASVVLKPTITSRRSSPNNGNVPHRVLRDIVSDVNKPPLDTI